MISEKMKPYVKNNSAIRMMFEEGNRLRAKYGADKVFDFSLGNPSVPAPDCVGEAIIELVNGTDPTILHGYMSNAGFEDVRQTIAESLNKRFDTKFSAKNLIMTVGAASGLNVILKTILNPGEEVIVFAPYFLEYGAYVRNYDGVLVEISPDTATFQPNLAEFEKKITPKTKAVIVNTPHNPTGVVYSEETIRKLSAILEAKQKEFGTVIYMISDEPYRELGDIPVQQKTDGKDLRIVHFLKRIKSHIIFIMSYLKIRPGNVINRPQEFQSQFFLLLIIRNGETSGNFCRICLSKLLCIMLPGHSFLAVFFIVQIIYTKSHVLPLPF